MSDSVTQFYEQYPLSLKYTYHDLLRQERALVVAGLTGVNHGRDTAIRPGHKLIAWARDRRGTYHTLTIYELKR